VDSFGFWFGFWFGFSRLDCRTHDIAQPVPSPAHPTNSPKTCTAFSVPWEDFAAFREKIA
jgi:hypothetical protein